MQGEYVYTTFYSYTSVSELLQQFGERESTLCSNFYKAACLFFPSQVDVKDGRDSRLS
jgi:hypothetical protein